MADDPAAAGILARAALDERFERVEEALREAEAAPLAARKARLLVALLDDFADRAWEAWKAEPDRVFGTEDVLEFRAGVAAASPAMATVMALAAHRRDGPRLEVQAVEVPLSDYPGLSVEDFMVSLYNRHTVMRVVIAGDGLVREALPVLRDAVEWWRPQLAG